MSEDSALQNLTVRWKATVDLSEFTPFLFKAALGTVIHVSVLIAPDVESALAVYWETLVE